MKGALPRRCLCEGEHQGSYLSRHSNFFGAMRSNLVPLASLSARRGGVTAE
jgi:hypothetical protein